MTPSLAPAPVLARPQIAHGGFLSVITRALLVLTMTVCVVIPHAFQVPTAALLTLTFMFAVLGIRQSEWLGRMVILYCLGVVVTVFYLFIGYLHGAPNDALVQITLVYIIAPIIWIVLGTSLIQRFGADFTMRLIVWLTWASLASIVLFFYAYLTLGKDSVSFLSEDANINVSGGFAGATMLVYGSMIFLTGAFFAQPSAVRWRIARFAMPAALIVAALTSGRSAFIIAIPIGYLVGVLLRPGLSEEARSAGGGGFALLPTLGMLIAGALGLVLLSAAFQQLDLNYIFKLFWGKLTSGGGDVRVEQARALWEGVEQSFGLGNGLGVGVRYLRSDEFPWRYELIPIASLLRVGIAGTIVYTLPFLVYGSVLVRRFRARELTVVDTYMAGGLVAALAGTVTNPYIESFIFQWMYFLPVVAIGVAEEQRTRALAARDLSEAISEGAAP